MQVKKGAKPESGPWQVTRVKKGPTRVSVGRKEGAVRPPDSDGRILTGRPRDSDLDSALSRNSAH